MPGFCGLKPWVFARKVPAALFARKVPCLGFVASNPGWHEKTEPRRPGVYRSLASHLCTIPTPLERNRPPHSRLSQVPEKLPFPPLLPPALGHFLISTAAAQLPGPQQGASRARGTKTWPDIAKCLQKCFTKHFPLMEINPVFSPHSHRLVYFILFLLFLSYFPNIIFFPTVQHGDPVSHTCIHYLNDSFL